MPWRLARREMDTDLITGPWFLMEITVPEVETRHHEAAINTLQALWLVKMKPLSCECRKQSQWLAHARHAPPAVTLQRYWEGERPLEGKNNSTAKEINLCVISNAVTLEETWTRWKPTDHVCSPLITKVFWFYPYAILILFFFLGLIILSF